MSFQDYAKAAAQRAGIDPNVFSAQIQQESGFNPNAKSPAGAIGIAQFMPETAAGVGLDPTDPYASLDAAAAEDAKRLKQYDGDWGKTLASYNAGAGAVAQYNGIPPYEETQNYVKTIMGNAQKAADAAGTTISNAVQDVKQGAQDLVQKGQTAVNNAVQGAQAIVARTSQFAMGLSSGDAMAFCGPAAAMAFAQQYGRNPTVDEAKQLAIQVGWNPNQGMSGVGSEVNLLHAMNIDAHATSGVDWGNVAQSASSGNPVIIDTPGHYFYVDGYNQDTGQFHLGSSATDLKAARGQEWFTPDQIPSLGMGDPRAAVFADHPLSQSSPTPPSSGQALTMGGNQPAGATRGDDLLSQLLNAGGSAASALGSGASSLLTQGQSLLNQGLHLPGDVLNQAQNVQSAVLNVGGAAAQTGQNLLNGAQNALSGVPQSANDLLNQSALGLPGVLSNLTPQFGQQGILSGLAPRIDLSQGLGGALASGLESTANTADTLGGAGLVPPDLMRVGAQVLRQPTLLDQLRTIDQLEAKYGTRDSSQYSPADQQAYQQALISGGATLGGMDLSGDWLKGGLQRLLGLGGGDLGGAASAPEALLRPADVPWSAASSNLLQQGPLDQQATPAILRAIDDAAQARTLGVSPDLLTGQFDDLGRRIPPGMLENPQTSADLGRASYDQYGVFQREPSLFSDRGIAMDPATGQEIVPPESGLLDFRTPMDSSAVLEGLQQMARERGLDPTSPILSQRLADLTSQVTSSFGSPLRNFLTGESSELGAANLALMRALGGGAAGGLGAYETTDPTDPNRALKIAGAAGLGALAAGGLPGTSPSGIRGTDWLTGYIKGGVIASPLTMADVGINSIASPILHTVINTVGDVLHGPAAPGRLAGRQLGTAQGINDWAGQFLNALTPSSASPTSLVGRAGTLPEQIAGYGGEIWGMTHGAFQQATQNFIRQQELGTLAGQAADKAGTVGSSAWNAAYRAFMASPPADAVTAAEATGARVAGRADPGEWVSQMTRLAGGGPGASQNTLQAMLFPAYRMGMNWMSRIVETSPAGLVGTAIDMARGMLGGGPYAAGLTSQPAGNTVGPLAQRLAYNAIGTALTAHFIYDIWQHMQDGTPTPIQGSWEGLTSQEKNDLRGQGIAPDTYLAPDGKWYSWDKAPWQLKGSLIAAGAYADAARAYAKAQALQQSAGSQAYGLEQPLVAAAGTLFNEVSKQVVNSTPLQTWANTYDTLTGGGGLAGGANMASSLAGETVPESGFLRGVNQMTDPYERQTLQPKTLDEVPPAILQNLEKNIPGLSENLPTRLDDLGRQVGNPMQGLAGVLRPAAGEPSPILQAMAQAGVAPSGAPSDIPYGPNARINLRPDEQRTFEQYRGQMIQQMAGDLVKSPEFQQMPDYAQQRVLATINQRAGEAAGRMLLADLAPNAANRFSATGVLAPVISYGPNPMDQMQQMRNHAAHQALIQALLSSA